MGRLITTVEHGINAVKCTRPKIDFQLSWNLEGLDQGGKVGGDLPIPKNDLFGSLVFSSHLLVGIHFRGLVVFTVAYSWWR